MISSCSLEFKNSLKSNGEELTLEKLPERLYFLKALLQSQIYYQPDLVVCSTITDERLLFVSILFWADWRIWTNGAFIFVGTRIWGGGVEFSYYDHLQDLTRPVTDPGFSRRWGNLLFWTFFP